MKKSIVVAFMVVIILLNYAEIFSNDVIIKVLTFNIYHGETMKGDFDLDKIASVINKINPDFVALQEVDYKTNRTKKYDLVTELAYRTKLSPLFGRAMYYDGGEYGEGILSKTTFIKTEAIPLPYTDNHEPRTALLIITELPSKDTICFIGTHLDHLKNDNNRIMQAKKINQILEKISYPVILAGDLNDTPHSRTISILEKKWTSTSKDNAQKTFPSNSPEEKIDYIMYYPQNCWEVLDEGTICDSIASDHCAYYAVLKLKNKNRK